MRGVTRDQKLALIVGFSVVLLVGILISDHFSRARHTRVTTIDPGEPVRVAQSERGIGRASPIGSTPRSESPVSSHQGNASLWPSTAVPIPEPTIAAADIGAPTLPRVETGEPPLADAMNDKPVASDPPPPSEFRIVSTPSATPNEVAPPTATAPMKDPILTEIVERGGSVREHNGVLDFTLGSYAASRSQPLPKPADSGLPDSPTSRVGTTNLADATPTDSRGVLAGAPMRMVPTRAHKVASGETLREISRRYYKDAGLWKKLAAFNAGVAKADGTIRVGSTLRIPPRYSLVDEKAGPTGVPTSTSVLASRDAMPSGKAVASAVKKAKPTKAATYTVRRGDTLSQIASRTLGSARRVDDLVRANPDLLEDDEATIRTGMVLRVPSV
jgi:nucleoid-associated protein YgaU